MSVDRDGPSLASILQAIGDHVADNRNQLSERDVESTFFDTRVEGESFFDRLGYERAGLDISQERTLSDGTRPDIITERGNTSVNVVYEFKEPTESLNKDKYLSQLRGYVEQLDADVGVLTNGLEFRVYDGDEFSRHSFELLSLPQAEDADNENTVASLRDQLHKDSWRLTDQQDVDAYADETVHHSLSLDNELAQEFFFTSFRFDRHGPFGNLIEAGMDLLEVLRERDEAFASGAFEFWRRSYARIPDEEDVPEAWNRYVSDEDGNIDPERLAEFMFTLESGFALLSRLFLAKSADDYQFFTDQTLRDRLGELSDRDTNSSPSTSSSEIDPVSYVFLVEELFEDLREELIESLFEDDIFLWWADGFDQSDLPADVDGETEPEATEDLEALRTAKSEFSTAVAELVISVLKFDFSRVDNVDLLGGLYQNYFDEETRKALGEFYTPAGVVDLILDRAEYNAGAGISDERLLDPACGSGTFLSTAIERYLDDVRQRANGDPDWQTALERLCLEPRIVGLDIHPFAVLMAQISITLSILDPYKTAKEADDSFTLRRLPVFRTNSLRKESQQPGAGLAGEGQQTLFDPSGSNPDAEIPITLPVTESDEATTADLDEQEEPFVETTIRLPKYDAIREVDRAGTGVDTYGEYFRTLLALLDVVKAHRNAAQMSYSSDCLPVEAALQRYLDRPVGNLESFLVPYVDGLLETLEGLSAYDSQGRLLPIFEDVALSLIVKNYLTYDFIIANPPYVDANNIDTVFKRELEAAYPETTTDKYDLYCPFYQRGVERLREGGTLGYITPNQFMVTKYGRGVRSYLDNHTAIQELYDFRDSGVFEDATNYPVVVIAEKQLDETLDASIHCTRVKRVDEDVITEDDETEVADEHQFGDLTAQVDVDDDEPTTIDTSLDERVLTAIRESVDRDTYSDPFIDVFPFDQADLRDEFWAPMPSAEWDVFTEIEHRADASLSGFLDLHAGTQTGANDIYIVTPIDIDRIDAGETGGTVRAVPKGSDEPVTLERDLLRPWLRGSDVERWRPEWSGEHVLFPYKEIQGSGGVESVPLDPDEIQTLEHTWAYLTANEEPLKEREGGAMESEEHWYAFTAPKSHVDLSRPKVIGAETASETRFALDENGSWLFKSAYGAPFPPELGDRREYLAAYLNSDVFDFYLKHVSSLKSGGHYKYTTSYVGRVPAVTEVDDTLQNSTASTISSITEAIDLRHKTERFPEAYIPDVSGEVRTVEYQWTESHECLSLDDIEITHNVDQEPQVNISDGDDLIRPEEFNASLELARYVRAALRHRSVTAGETTRIPYPVDEVEREELRSQLEADRNAVEAVDVDSLGDELNEELYSLFDLDETAVDTISTFLSEYSDR